MKYLGVNSKEDKFINTWFKPRGCSLLAQVGRGESNNIDLIANDIAAKLLINRQDIILDVCCGNGLLTKKIADKCKEIHGLDFSKILINTALKKNAGPNIYYHLDDAINVEKIFPANSFDKIYLYFSFQHLNYSLGFELIKHLSNIIRSDGLLLIGDIPDINRRWIYYSTLRKKILFCLKHIHAFIRGKGHDSLGWWWDPSTICNKCRDLNLKCQILKQDKSLPHSHYRFDVLIEKR